MKPREKQILEKRLKDFMEDIIPLELLPFLPCLRQQDREEIEAKQLNHGPLKATFVLVDRLKRKDRGFQEFVEALRECGGEHIAMMLDPYCLHRSEGHTSLCSSNSSLDVISYKRGDRRAMIRTMTSRSSRAILTGPDQLISTIPYRVYSKLVLLLTRDRISIASRLFDLTLEEATALKDITDRTCSSTHQSLDAVFQLMSERLVTVGELVQVLREMQRLDAISVLDEAGYSEYTSDESCDQDVVTDESLSDESQILTQPRRQLSLALGPTEEKQT